METLIGLVVLVPMLLVFAAMVVGWVYSAFQTEEDIRRRARIGAKHHPIDLIDEWAKKQNVRIIELNRVDRGWDGRGAEVGYRLVVYQPDGGSRFVSVYCGDRVYGLRSESVEAVWDDDGPSWGPKNPRDDSLWDDGLDNVPTA